MLKYLLQFEQQTMGGNMKNGIGYLTCICILSVFNACLFSSRGAGDSNEVLSGTILDLQGNPVSEALVLVSSAPMDTGLAKTAIENVGVFDSSRTDDVGHFQFSTLKMGRYNLECSFKKDSDTQTVSISGIQLDGKCDVGKVAPTSPKTIYAAQDVGIDSEDWNVGLGSDLRLYPDGIVLVGFTGIKSTLAGKKIQKAELVLHGMASPAATDYLLYTCSVSGSWAEGAGNWYYFDGAKHNNYDVAYEDFPQYVPPAGSMNPASASGIRWSNSTALRNSLQIVDSSVGFVPTAADHYLPLDSIGLMTLDVTRFFSDSVAVSDTLSIAIESKTAATLYMFSKDFVSPQLYGPQLVLYTK